MTKMYAANHYIYSTITGIIILLFISSSFSAEAQSTREVHFASDPAVSPDGSTVVFQYETDLWKVASQGGIAVRLTGMEGEESNPVISPDGNWLAFSSSQYGNDDLYVMPLEGGTITRLTFHQSGDNPESWSWDSNTIYFRSSRYNSISSYSVGRQGGTPARLFEHYHNNVHNLVEHPVSGEFYFNESWESFIFPHRKKYRGPFNPDIKSYNPETGEFTVHTDWEGKDFWTTIDREGNIYFVSDESNGEYNLYTIRDGNKRQLTNFNTSVKNPNVSADGSTIVFEREYQLYRYDTESGNSQKIPVSVYKNNTLSKSQSFNVENEIEAFDISPDKKKIAFVSRGELFVSDLKGKFIRKVETAPSGRVMEVKWLSDSKNVIFNQTVEGYQNWFTTAAYGSGAARQLTDDSQNNRMLELDPDREKGVYLSGRNELRLIDLESMESETIVEDEFWGFFNEQPRFAPNGEYVIYTARRDFEHDLFTYHIDSGETMNLTRTGVSETDQFWSPDGRHIYFSSSRVNPSYPRGGSDNDLYRMALDSYDDPFKSDKIDELFKEEEKESEEDEKKGEENGNGDGDEEKKKDEVEITINPDGLMERLEQVGPGFGNQIVRYVIQNDDKTTVLFASNHDEGQYKLWKTTFEPFEHPKTEMIDGINGFVTNVTENDGKIYGTVRGSIYSINVSSGKAEKIDMDFEFERNLREEFDQMFDEMWANIEENFYNETFHGIDWKEIRDRYKEYLPYVNSRNDFRRMMNDMLGELNSSHMGFGTFGPEEQEFHSTVSVATGILFEEDNPYRVRRVVSDSPADVAGKDIRPGDLLTAVDGKPVDRSQNRERYLSKPDMPEEVTLTFRRDGRTHDVKLHPTSYFSVRSDLYDEWVDRNQQIVDQQTDKRIAYVHMKNMGGFELQNFLVEMTSEAYHRDGLILDLRYNTGGNVHNDVLQFLAQQPYLQWKYRNGDYASQPNFVPQAKPIVLLVNEQSLSDAEVTAAGFKELGLGTVIGNETYRWIIFTSGKGLVDGSFYRLPSWGVYTLDGKNLERTGVSPHIEVDNTFKHRLDGDDPQLQRAIDEVMKGIGGN